ncbi:radical SAM protein [Pseudobdellovibrio exovorus]|uniref:Radical SAM core domain-containing protein n=1 Tax=Pseudobdellovibrio exovorus JSS TaxID=1184267 RepID=M4VTN2_9BACT|nr:radical SAM protein [Pseudobdellovibrio exovorus]AGH96554.1 hypothetical protein A11Q_2338 [Pseudobdellovibrio exovorus JSS]
MFWSSEQINQIHIELTNVCNAACPVCLRFYRNSPLLRPDLTLGQITLEKFQQYFPSEILKQCRLALFCGVHGDPSVARDTLEIFQYIANSSENIIVRMNTNGGARKPEWWYELGKLFASRADKEWHVTFSIDGLQDTNHLYRRKVVWEDLMANATAFISAGGKAYWDFLIFKHNEHQIDEAMQLSKSMGFQEFVPKKAVGVDDGVNLIPMPAVNAEGQVDYWIEAPVRPENRNLENPQGQLPPYEKTFKPDQYKDLKARKANEYNYSKLVSDFYRNRRKKDKAVGADSCQINCKSKIGPQAKEIFVDNFGRVFPCCYVGSQLNAVFTDDPALQLHHHMEEYGWEHFDLNKSSLKEILAAGHLDRLFADSWAKPSMLEGRLEYCVNMCGKVSGIDKIFTHHLNNKEKKSN